MVSSPLQQIPSTSVDLAGLSITTANRSTTDPRPGAVYDPNDLAAAVPISFYPIGARSYMMINSLRWTAATVDSTDPAAYTAWTDSATPSWAIVDGATGSKSAINGAYDIPMTTANDSRVLTAVEHLSPNMLYLLNDVTVGSTHSAVIQVWHVNTAIGSTTGAGTVNLVAEETIPVGTNGGDTVAFNKGVYRYGSDMYFFGAGSSTSQVYLARKSWSRLGFLTAPGGSSNAVAPYWEYYTGTGWGTDPTVLAPVQTTTGPMTTHGPIAVAQYGLSRTMPGRKSVYTLLSTVAASGSVRTAQVYASLSNRPYQPVGSPVALGSAGTTYLGGTLQWQSTLGVQPSLVTTPDSSTAIPYLTAVKSTSGGASKISITWGCWQVPRHQ